MGVAVVVVVVMVGSSSVERDCPTRIRHADE
jgi:hypothetical protein